MEIKKGLQGVVADESAISKVIPEKKSLIYRGYAADVLSRHRSFLEVVFLLWKGELPSKKELVDFEAREKQVRKILPQTLSLLKECVNSHPMDALRTAVSLEGALSHPWDLSDSETENRAICLLSRIPLWIAALNRLKNKQDVQPPDQNLSFTENFFHCCFGKIPEEKVLKAFESMLVLYADHGFNASTFTARVITSTTSDIYSAVSGAVGALKGPLHGGANERVMYMMKEIGQPEKARPWLLKALSEKKKIMGFGHRVYTRGDARVPQMFRCAEVMASVTGQNQWIEIYNILKDTMWEKKSIHPNLDFPAGPAYYMMGFDIPLFTPLFVMARVAGWSVHIMEQRKNNRIIRPLSKYTGPALRTLPSEDLQDLTPKQPS